ncbi:MAG: radical SAM protein [Candidatus Diapherotrites archaeon]|nr:radical SAM protein [Candidatus Diapherotrites archaeon]
MSYFLFQMKRSLERFVFTEYFTFGKFLNAASIFSQAFIFKNSKVFAHPIKVTLDPTNICMLSCPLCPTGQKRKERPLGKMKFEDFKKLVEEISPYLYEIDLNNWGEPFLNDEVYKMIEFAHSKKIKTSVNTNLNVKFTEKQAERIVKSGLDVLYCSFDGISQKTYEKYRINGKLKTVFENIRLVNKKKKELGSKKPSVTWQFLVMKHNEKELPELQKIKNELEIDTLLVGAVRTDLGKEIFQSDNEKVSQLEKWLPQDSQLSRYDYESRKRKLQREYCYFPWLVAVINWDGSTSPCCAVYQKKDDFGNVFKDGFKKVWNNEKYRQARRIIAKKAPEAGNVCSNCIRTGFID